ncbi:hypothetical protein [Methanocella arvoryzae]|nr:hypothetical protein [Methanocella arvoryzae]
MIAAQAGAIYLEGQAPPDDTSPHILAASSGPAESNGPATAIPEELSQGDAVVLFHARFPYLDVRAMDLPKVPTQTMDMGSLSGLATVGRPSIGPAGYGEGLSSLKFPAWGTESPFRWALL